MKNLTALIALTLLGLASAQPATTAPAPAKQTTSPLKMVLVRSQVVTTTAADGKKTETLKANPVSTKPGDVLEDTNTATNVGKLPLRTININMNITPGVYVATSASRNDIKSLFSIDNGKTFAAAPLKKTVTVQENGKSVTKQVDVSPSEYTNVRFVIPGLAAGESVKSTVRFRVQ